MTDREKVIKAIECRKNVHKRCSNPCERTGNCKYAAWIRSPDGEPYYPCYCDVERLCEDVIALLREQEKVVLCKDCKYCEYPKSEKEWCKNGHLHGNAETWFCADGEER